jgi:hypothetical protein
MVLQLFREKHQTDDFADRGRNDLELASSFKHGE